MANEGFFAGGFGSGVAQGIQTGQQLVEPITDALELRRAAELEQEQLRQAREVQDRRLQLMRDQMTAKQQADFRKTLATDIKNFGELVGDIAKQRGPEAARRFLESPSAQATINTLERRGFVSGSTMSVTNLLEGQIASVATPGERAEQTVAEIDATAEALGVDPQRVAQAQGLVPAPEDNFSTLSDAQAQAEGFAPGTVVARNSRTGELSVKQAAQQAASTIGKLQQDRNTFVARFGADSPQVQAIEDAIELERAGAAPDLTDVRQVRQEHTKLSADFVIVRDAFQRIETTAENPSAAGDIALLTSYMKLLDPGSVVREGEFATAQNAGGVPQQIRSQYNRILTGERLAESQREDFLAQSKSLFARSVETQKMLDEQFRALARRNGMAPENVVLDFVGSVTAPRQESTRQPVGNRGQEFSSQLPPANANRQSEAPEAEAELSAREQRIINKPFNDISETELRSLSNEALQELRAIQGRP